MAEWLERRTINLEALSSSPPRSASWICSQYSPKFKFWAMLVNNQLAMVCV